MQSDTSVVYTFNVKIKGKVDINLTSNKNFIFKAGKNSCVTGENISAKNVNFNLYVNPDDKVFIKIEKKSSQVVGKITFTPEIIEDTHDICYRQKTEDGFFCFKDPLGIPVSGGINCKYTYDIDVFGSLENVIIDHVDPTLFQGNAFKSCGINPQSTDKTCEIANRIDLWKFGFLDKSLEYNLNNLSSDDNLSIWVKSIVNLELFSSENTYVRYIKNGYLHIGRLNQCDDYTKANLLDFRKIFDEKINGKLLVTGNTNLCKSDNEGKCINPSKSDNNDNVNLKYVKINNESDVSYAKLDLKNGDEIVWAGLFWQGRIKTENPNESEKVKKAKIVKFKLPNESEYREIEANSDSFNWYYSDKYNIFDYAGFRDITDIIRNAGGGKYYLKDLQLSEGKDSSGGWALAVVVKNRNYTFKKVVVYQGFKPLWDKDGFDKELSINVDGFKAKSKGKVDSSLVFFANETDLNMADDIKFNNKTLSDKLNPSNDIMNSTVSTNGKNVSERYPNFVNNLGINIDKIDLSDYINNSETNANIKFKTDNDRYLLSMVGFCVELDIPKICYYNMRIYDENNNTVNIDDIKKGQKYFIEYNIKNEENFPIEDFYVVNQFNSLSYIKNSTYVKNANQQNLNHIDDNASLNDLKVLYSDKTLKIGKIKDKDNYLMPFDKEKNNYAKIKYQTMGLFNSKYDTAIYGDYYFTNANYSGLLAKCVDDKTPPSNIIGNFDAFDADETSAHRIIKTKIAGKPFVLKIVFISPQNAANLVNGTNVFFQLYDSNTNNPITNFEPFSLVRMMINKSFNVDKAYKNVKVRFKYCTKNSSLGMIYPTQLCDNHTPGYTYDYSFSSDSFAIRPYKFVLSTPIKATANKEFNLTVKAVDFNNNVLNNYNETVSFVSSPKIEYNETKPGCKRGNITFSNFNFHNGVLNTNARYSDIGNLILKIKEIQGSEFAKTDNSDTPWNDRKIISDSKTIIIKPYKFLISGQLNNFKNKNFTYISNDLNMSAELNVSVKAVGFNDSNINNYTKNCYAKNTTLKIEFNNNQPIRKLLMKIDGYNEINTDPIIGYIEQSLQKNVFENNSTAQLNIKINFEKNYRTPTGDFNFTVNKIEGNDGEINGTMSNVPGRAHFVYGYFKPYDIAAYPKIFGNSYQLDFNYKIYYFKNNKVWILNKYHNFGIFGDVNISKSFGKDISIQKSIVNNGILKIKFITNHSIPFKSKVHLSIPSWLWYHPLAEGYQDPSIFNQNCLTHPCIGVSFLNESLGWGGVSNKNNKYNENNRTGNIIPSLKKINTNKNTLRKLNW